MVKDLGKEVLRFLSQIVKDWTPEEVYYHRPTLHSNRSAH